METLIYLEKQPKVVLIPNTYLIRINVLEDRGTGNEDYLYLSNTYNSALKYSTIVNDIITWKYPNDKMQAIINNYLLDPTDEKALEEFNKMQNFRALAKQEARECMELYNRIRN